MPDAPTLRDFFRDYFLPVVMASPCPRTIEQYHETLELWRQATGDPAIAAITATTLRGFVVWLEARPGRRSTLLSPNTVRKHLRHVQAVLDRAGPPGPRRRDAADLVERVPWVRPPRAILRSPTRPTPAEVAAIYQASDAARLPRLGDASAATWWRAVISTACSTSLRIGQLTRISGDSIDWHASTIGLEAELSPKSRRDQVLPLHPAALRDLLPLRHRATPLAHPHAPSTIYRELERLGRLAGLQASRRWRFHALRRAALTDLSKHSLAAASLAAGHAHATTTLNHYVANEVLAEAVAGSPLLAALAAS